MAEILSDAGAIIEFASELCRPAILPTRDEGWDERLALVAKPNGQELVDLKPFLDKLRVAPERIEAAALTTTVGSFIDYVNRFKIADSAVFLKDDPLKSSLLGVIDFHGGSPDQTVTAVHVSSTDSTPGSWATPRFGAHTVRYEFPLADQFKAWSEIYGKPLSHEDMATFLAERQYDIANPPLDWMMVDAETVKLILHLLNIGDDQGDVNDTAPHVEPADDGEDRYIPRSALYKLRQIRFGSVHRLIQMARTIEISAQQRSVEGYNPRTGERTVKFEEEHDTRDKAGRQVIVPDAFLLRIPVFEGETPQLLPVRLQYRRAPGGGIKWFMTLVEWRRAVRFAVKTEADRVASETGLPLFCGSRQAL